MYMFEGMLDMALGDGKEWRTEYHKLVAVHTCLHNQLVKDMGTLAENVRIINNIDVDKIKKVTGQELLDRGCYF